MSDNDLPPEPPGYADYANAAATSDAPELAAPSAGWQQITQAMAASQPVQNIVTGQGLQDYQDTLNRAITGDSDAQLAIANHAAATAAGSLKLVPPPEAPLSQGEVLAGMQNKAPAPKYKLESLPEGWTFDESIGPSGKAINIRNAEGNLIASRPDEYAYRTSRLINAPSRGTALEQLNRMQGRRGYAPEPEGSPPEQPAAKPAPSLSVVEGGEAPEPETPPIQVIHESQLSQKAGKLSPGIHLTDPDVRDIDNAMNDAENKGFSRVIIHGNPTADAIEHYGLDVPENTPTAEVKQLFPTITEKDLPSNHMLYGKRGDYSILDEKGQEVGSGVTKRGALADFVKKTKFRPRGMAHGGYALPPRNPSALNEHEGPDDTREQHFDDGGVADGPLPLNAFTGPAPSIGAPAQSSSSLPPPPPGYDDYAQSVLSADQYGTPLEQAKAGAEGIGQGLFGALAPAAEMALGVDPKDIRGRAAENPWTHGIGEAVGLVGPALATAGLSGEARLAAEGLSEYTQSGVIEAINKKLIPVAGETLASKIGTGAAQAALDNFLITGSDEVSKKLMGDPDASAQSYIATLGLSSAMAAVLGGTVSGGLALWNQRSGGKVAQVVSDFRDRMKAHADTPDPISAMADELNTHYNDMKGMADEVYGPQGLKARDIAVSMPAEANEGMFNQAQSTLDTMTAQVKKMQADPYTYPQRLTNKLYADTQNLASKIATSDGQSGPLFSTLQDLKQTLQGYAKFDYSVKPTDEAYDFIKDVKGLANGVRTGLEDPEVWGNAAKRQSAINEAFSDYLPALKKFEKKFTAEGSVPDPDNPGRYLQGQRVIDPQKVASYMTNLGKPSAEIRQSMLQEYLDASDKYAGVIRDTHLNLGMEPPTMASPLNVTRSTLDEKTLGSRLADIVASKVKSPGEWIGGGVGGLLGGMQGAHAGHTVLGAEIGGLVGNKVLSPFINSVFQAITKSVMENDVSAPAFKQAVDYGVDVAKSNSMMDKAVDSIFKAGSVINEALLPQPKEVEKLKAILNQAARNPASVTDNADNGIAHYLPAHANAMDQTLGSAISYLNSLKPSTQRMAPLDSDPVLSAAQQGDYNNALALAQKPLSILQKIQDGTITQNDMTHLSHIYPGLVRDLSAKLTDAMTEHLAKGESIPYKTRLGLSLFTAQPMDSTMSPQALQAAQSVSQSATQQPPPQAQAKRGRASAPALQKIPSIYQTADQAKEQRRNS